MDNDEVTYRLVRVKRWWVPEAAWRFLARWNLPSRIRWLRWATTAEPDPFTARRINGK